MKKVFVRIEIFNGDESIGDLSLMMDFQEIKNIDDKDIFVFSNANEKHKKYKEVDKIEKITPVLKTFQILEDKKTIFSKQEEACKNIIFSINPPLKDENIFHEKLKEIKTKDNYLIIFTEESDYVEEIKEQLS
jgi:hypothetical protein